MQTSVQMSNSTLLIKTLLSQGLYELKDYMSMEIKTMSTGFYNYPSELEILVDELENMVQDPLDMIQELVGYVEDIEYNDPTNTNLQEALVELSQDKELWDFVNKRLAAIVQETAEYKVLINGIADRK